MCMCAYVWYACVWMHICVCVYICISMCACVVCIYVYVHVYICVCMCVCKSVHAFVHTHSTLCNHIGNLSTHSTSMWVPILKHGRGLSYACGGSSSKPHPNLTHFTYIVGTFCLTSLIPGLKYISAHDMVPQPLANACSSSGTVTPLTTCWESTEKWVADVPKSISVDQSICL